MRIEGCLCVITCSSSSLILDDSLQIIRDSVPFTPPPGWFLILAGRRAAHCQQSSALIPSQLQQAYYQQIAPSQCNTIAIIDPGTNNVSSVLSDLATYRSTFGLSPAQITLYNQYGQPLQTSNARAPGYCSVTTDSAQITEQQLDLQMVSAMCPCCPLVYYAANSDASDDLFQAVQTAVANATALNTRVVSISWGALESQAKITDQIDAYLFNHTGLVFMAASGDTGYHVSYPASSQFVTSVGGTALNVDAYGNRVSEVLWTSGGSPGSGCSAYISRPAWQPLGACGNKRTVTDISATAGGVQIYAQGVWIISGGTSSAAPIISAMYAGGYFGDVNSMSYNSLAGSFYPGGLNHDRLYDITTGGSTQGCTATISSAYLCTALPGYDGPTGNGAPSVNSSMQFPPSPGLRPPSPPAPPSPAEAPPRVQSAAILIPIILSSCLATALYRMVV
ncbi:hypothetical protein CEUSTIGMA_g4805.t1 [Chlamydomonas eustigma]|uniref:Peptidase S53 domain-containing protein n=1 Tax=Chlamydomonas eustigma TaxID=1157962 RepID=A0A250X346_9CHLO|nr:hypothetical protein CEUSTIGMA_g4805.t1 [Chlamydomonas eustigma]|eukprot:GAX77359.1 hypothetical protein CEUSTIGMA_g4805.t1 [Chlamydomonas eustigma]